MSQKTHQLLSGDKQLLLRINSDSAWLQHGEPAGVPNRQTHSTTIHHFAIIILVTTLVKQKHALFLFQ